MSTKITTGLNRHVIVDGPSLDRIGDALKYAGDRFGATIPLRFVTGSGINLISLHVSSAVRRVGCGKPLDITGRLDDSRIFEGHYDAHTRSGYILIH